MPNPNAVVSNVILLKPSPKKPSAQAPASEHGIIVELEGERRARLDPDDPRSAGFAQILDGLSKQHLPVYVEIDPQTSTISRLLIPHVSRVKHIGLVDQGVLGVELELSHGRHLLLSSSEDFDELERRLREAIDSGEPVLLTEDDAHEIIDVRGYTPGPDGPPIPFPEPGPPPDLPWPRRWLRNLLRPFWCRWPWWPWWPWCWFRCVSEAHSQQVFNAMNATSCDPLTVPSPCIPFLYPDDGCWGRAHEMYRLMIGMGLHPKKVWIKGSLHVSTNNNPNCAVWWGWHVAPTLCVRGPGFFQVRYMVIDPSLFTTPVTKATWKGVQGDPAATLTDTAASVFHLWANLTDPTYAQTNQVLAYYRLQLQNRAIQHGPPPYAQCP